MIPQGREVRTETEVAAARGMPLHTWRRRERAEFERRVVRVNPNERVRLYDGAQADADTSGCPIPPGPDLTVEHPDDLLTDKEVAELLDIQPSTVRTYGATGYLRGGVGHHGRRWPRWAVNEWIEQGDQREHPERTGAGRPHTSPTGPNRGRAGAGHAPQDASVDPRVRETAVEIARRDAQGATPPTASETAARYGVSRTTGASILRSARTLDTQPGGPGP